MAISIATASWPASLIDSEANLRAEAAPPPAEANRRRGAAEPLPKEFHHEESPPNDRHGNGLAGRSAGQRISVRTSASTAVASVRRTARRWLPRWWLPQRRLTGRRLSRRTRVAAGHVPGLPGRTRVASRHAPRLSWRRLNAQGWRTRNAIQCSCRWRPQ